MRTTESKKRIWYETRKSILKLEGVEDPEKVDKLADEFYSVLLKDCSVIEAEKVVEFLSDKIQRSKELILREPLENVLKYKED